MRRSSRPSSCHRLVASAASGPGRDGEPPRILPVLALALPLLALPLAGCTDLFVGPASPVPATVSVSFSLAPGASELSGGPTAAFDRADILRIRLLRMGADETATPVLDTVLDFTPKAETRVHVPVELESDQERFLVKAELLLGSALIFRGDAVVELREGVTTEAELALQPIPAGVRLMASVPEMRSLGATIELEGAVVFTTGDTIPGLALSWSTLDPRIVEVSPDGRVVSREEGEARVIGAFAGHSDMVLVRVAPVVASVVVEPAAATLEIGESLQLRAVLRDSLSNELEGRDVAHWSSSQPAVAEVDAGGRVTANAAGSATITATSQDGPEGAARITVDGLAPSVTTDSVSSVIGGEATLWGTVNPNGEETQAWFEWGTDPDLGAATAPQPLGSGTVAGEVSAGISGLQPATAYFYRVVAQNGSGSTQGQIRQFHTSEVVPAAPSGLVATTVSNSRIDLNWTDNSDNEDGFRIERCSGQGCSAFAEIATVGADVTSFQNTGLDPATTYRYRVRAFNAAGESDPSNIASATSPPPAAPIIQLTPGSAVLEGQFEGESVSTSVDVRSGNESQLSGLAATVVSYSPDLCDDGIGNACWLDATLGATTAPTTLRLTASPTGSAPSTGPWALATGLYTAVVEVSSTLPDVEPQALRVEFGVSGQPGPPLLSGASVRVGELNDPGCHVFGSDEVGTSFEVRFEYSDPDGDVPLSTSAIGGTWVFNPSRNTGSVTTTYRFAPTIHGDRYSGRITTYQCYIFRGDSSVDVTMTLTDAAGNRGEIGPIRIPRPAGAN